MEVGLEARYWAGLPSLSNTQVLRHILRPYITLCPSSKLMSDICEGSYTRQNSTSRRSRYDGPSSIAFRRISVGLESDLVERLNFARLDSRLTARAVANSQLNSAQSLCHSISPNLAPAG